MKKIILYILLICLMFTKASALVCEDGTFEVVYNANKGKMKLSSECVEDTLTLVKPTRSGYAFLGWSKSKTASSPLFKAGDEIELSGKTTLYAVWSKGRKLSFNANGGKSSKKSKTVYKGLNYGTLPTASKKGYTFLGWYTKKSGGSIVDSDMIVNSSKNFSVYAHYKKNTYTINYILNGGVNSTKNKTNYNITTSTFNLYSPTKIGYTFSGWYTSSNYKTKVTKIKKGTTGNKTYYAKWTVNKYNISFNGNGSTSGKMTSQTNLKYDTLYTLNSNKFIKKGYVFAGWNTKKDGSGVSYDNSDVIINLTSGNKKTVTLYAQWKYPEYSINYELNEGVNPTDALTKYNSNLSYTLPIPNREGYVFDGWYLEDNFVNKITKIEIGSNGDKTVYAKWIKIEDEIVYYTITYELNGGVNSEFAITTFTKNDEIILLEPTRGGYEFDGWYLENNFVNKITKINIGTKENIIIYAKWDKIDAVELYNITYILNGGINPIDAPQNYTSDYSVVLPIPEREEYTFEGWYLESDFINKVTTISIGSSGDKTFYAKWIEGREEIIEYDINYVLNGGHELINPIIKYTRNDEITLPIPSKDDNTFEGWYTEPEFINKVIKIELGSSGNKTYYAKWIELEIEPNERIINYVLNGGTNPVDAKTSYTMDDEVILPIPSRYNSEFIGWYTDSEYTNKITKINKGSNTDYTLYAKWNFITKRNYSYQFYTNNNQTTYTIKNQSDIKNAIYNGLNNSVSKLTLNCNYSTISACFNDFNTLFQNAHLLSSISNYVNPFNRYYNISYSQISNGIVGRIEITFNMKYTEEEKEEINNIIDYNLNGLNLNEMTDEEKIKWAHDYLVNKNHYDLEAEPNIRDNSYSAYGAIVGDKAVCQGYAEAMALFLDRFNIPNILVASQSHIWNLVYLDGQWVHLDVTWDDPVYSDGHQGLIYDYYLITSTELSKKDKGTDHTYDNTYYLETNFN